MSYSKETGKRIESWQEKIGFQGKFVHVCIITDDIHRAICSYEAFTGTEASKLKQTGKPEDACVTYLGKETPTRAWQTFFNVGDMRVEILQPDEYPSTWKAFLDQSGQGLHHVGFEVDDLEDAIQKLEKAGCRIIQTGLYNGGKYVYMDTEPQLGMMIELLYNY